MGLLDRFRDFRNRKVADPAFRRWASRFPLTRPIARREARRLFDLTAGFVYAQTLAACVQLDLFDRLADGPLPAARIAALTGLREDAAIRLLKAAAALDLVEARPHGHYALGSLGAAMVGNEGVSAMVRHHEILYADLANPLALLRGEASAALQRYWAYAGAGVGTAAAPAARRHRDYTQLMAASQAMIADEVLHAYPVTRHRRLLDVGGGDGSFIIAAAARAPGLELAIFDLPPVASIARERILAAGLSSRARVHSGSFLADPLPAGYDLITLNRVLHDHDDAIALRILESALAALGPGGTVLVTEPMSGTPGARASGDAYFGLYLLAMGQGRPRTAAEIEAIGRQAGFRTVRAIATATPIVARSLAFGA